MREQRLFFSLFRRKLSAFSETLRCSGAVARYPRVAILRRILSTPLRFVTADVRTFLARATYSSVAENADSEKVCQGGISTYKLFFSASTAQLSSGSRAVHFHDFMLIVVISLS